MTTYHERRKARYDNAIATYNAEWYDGYADERIGQLFKLIKFYVQQINKDDNCFGKLKDLPSFTIERIEKELFKVNGDQDWSWVPYDIETDLEVILDGYEPFAKQVLLDVIVELYIN